MQKIYIPPKTSKAKQALYTSPFESDVCSLNRTNSNQSEVLNALYLLNRNNNSRYRLPSLPYTTDSSYRKTYFSDRLEAMNRTNISPNSQSSTRTAPGSANYTRTFQASNSSTNLSQTTLNRPQIIKQHYSSRPSDHRPNKPRPIQTNLSSLFSELSTRDKISVSTYPRALPIYTKIRSPSCPATENQIFKKSAHLEDFVDNALEPSSVNDSSNTHNITKSLPRQSLKTISSISVGLVGLANLGNTCFMNSTTQCLSNTLPLLNICMNMSYHSLLNKNSRMQGNLFTSYAELMQQLWSTDSSTPSYVRPQNFRSQIQKFAPRFVGTSQQDSQEFLRYLLQGLHEDVNRIHKLPHAIIPNYAKEDQMDDKEKADLYWRRYKRVDDSIMSDIFMGQLMSTLTCETCGYKSTTFDPFWDLSLPVPKKTSVNIFDCLDLFTSTEELSGSEKPMCSQCKVHQRCEKRLSIQRFPPILVIQFKRFSDDRLRSKISLCIDYPLEDLNLRPYESPICEHVTPLYDLYAVSNHRGTAYGGHYTAYCLHPFQRTWLEFNDSKVSRIDKEDVVSPEAYILFYQQKERFASNNFFSQTMI